MSVASPTRRLFGTDGMRGVVNQEPMTPETVLRVAMASALELREGTLYPNASPHRTGSRVGDRRSDSRQLVVIGKDPRCSSCAIECLVTSGFLVMGVEVELLGVIPTAAIAMLVLERDADLGVMISASHNRFQDNGIKLFATDGCKLSLEQEMAIERRATDNSLQLASPGRIGRSQVLVDAPLRYVTAVLRTSGQLQLGGWRIVLDCANGAAYRVAPEILRHLGASVIPLGVDPDGYNINHGSRDAALALLKKAVLEHKADIGLSLDGDADRLLVVDELGQIIDGDQMMALLASAWTRAGKLRGSGIVATVMSNLGLRSYLQNLRLTLAVSGIGDRQVIELMRTCGHNLGGEQSGHLIMSDHCPTGDGMITALQILAQAVVQGAPMSKIGHCFKPVHQVMCNLPYDPDQGSPLTRNEVRKAIVTGQDKLGSQGQLLVRHSGTEPLIRIMAQGDKNLVTKVIGELKFIFDKAISSG